MREVKNVFGKKEMCSICGSKPGVLTKAFLKDGVICGSCAEQCCQHLSRPQQRTVANIKDHIAYCAKNREALKYFQPTDQAGELYVDSIHKIWYIDDTRRKDIRNPLILKYAQLLDYSVTEDGETIHKSGAGRAVAGGLLFGGIGLVAGGLSGRKTKEVISKMTITVMIDSEWIDSIDIPIITTEVKKGGWMYNLAKDTFNKTTALLDRILSENRQPTLSEQAQKGSAADEIQKYKQLLDCGAITQEEFEKMKTKLLNL